MKFNSSLYGEVQIDRDQKYADIMVPALDLDRLVASSPDKNKPVYNWVYYKPSFSSPLVFHLLESFNVRSHDIVLDPFCGIGTTAVACKERGITSWNSDISPYCVFVTRVKAGDYDIEDLEASKYEVFERPFHAPAKLPATYYLQKCFTREELEQIQFYWELFQSSTNAEFMELALLSIVDQFTSARKDGGFLRFEPPGPKRPIEELRPALLKKITDMISDVASCEEFRPSRSDTVTILADSRNLGFEADSCDYIITSPPYLNRYDYTRMYALELEMLLLDDEKLKQLRKDTLKSHVEATGFPPVDPCSPIFTETHEQITHTRLNNPQLPAMISGYFSDMTWCFKEFQRVLKPGGKAAIVVGNCRFSGVHVEVDRIFCEMAENIGLNAEQILVTKLRGSSAQQVNAHGEIQLREGIIILSR
jgi:DNA modification methylase